MYHIIKSVAKWTWRRFEVKSMEEGVKWREKQAYRGSKGGTAKGLANEDKRASAQIMRAIGMNNTKIAQELGVTRQTVINWFNDV